MKILSFFIISIYLLGCVRDSSYSNYSETGIASYYHSKFNNRKTASGDFFSQEQHTAAHKDLPFGSELKVTNLENGKTIIACDKAYYRPLEVNSLLGSAKKARKLLNWKPKTNVDMLISEMVQFELNKISYK